MKKIILLLITLIIIAGCSQEEATNQNITITTITEQLQQPWGFDFVNESTIIITQKQGTISLVDIATGEINNIQKVPEVAAQGQGGLLDIHLHEEYVYLTYSASYETGTTTHLARAIIDYETHELQNLEILYKATPAQTGGAHFGSRILVHYGYVFFTIGDRGDKNFGPEHVSQNTSNTLGTVIRLHTNGSIPQDNPFIDNDSVIDSIYTFGHRNPQGITMHPETKKIWISDHGEQDGDEINILEAGGNYGWPIAHYGCTYALGRPIGELPHENPGTINPVYYWECKSGGFPPSGMTFYSGDVFPEWRGDLFIGNLAHQYLGHFSVTGRKVTELEPLVTNKGRIRDVQQSPDGYLYFISDNGGLYRVEPATT